ncbi:hypothetical protein ACGC1H_004542 [Rhizoctonia solani]
MGIVVYALVQYAHSCFVTNDLKTDNPSAGTGACGWQNYDYEWVAAVGTQLFQELTPGITTSCYSAFAANSVAHNRRQPQSQRGLWKDCYRYLERKDYYSWNCGPLPWLRL